MLHSFKVNEPARIKIDVSNLAIGACLCQEKEGKWHLVAYFSRKILVAEQNYDIYNKELLVVVNALEQWRQYAESYLELTIYTNYKNLLSFTTTKALNRR